MRVVTLTSNAVDRRVYEEQIAPWLPDRIADCHVHVGLGEGSRPISPERLKAMWALEVGCHQSWQQMRETYRMLFPEQRVSSLAFGNVYNEIDTQHENAYVLHGILDQRNDAAGLFVTRPETSSAEIAEALSKGFVGIKPYPDFVNGRTMEVSIYEFLPKSHLEMLQDAGGILMLHLPRAGRLGDPNNIREIIEIAETYPRVRMVIAHIGRAYCLPAAKRGLPALADHSRILFDTSANLNPDVFQYALETVGPHRLLFGTDLPVMLMRGIREHRGEQYVNYTSGPYVWNTDRKSPEEEANYTFYVYEAIKALIKAIERAGYGKAEMEKITYSNSAEMLGLSVSNQRVVGAGLS